MSFISDVFENVVSQKKITKKPSNAKMTNSNNIRANRMNKNNNIVSIKNDPHAPANTTTILKENTTVSQQEALKEIMNSKEVVEYIKSKVE